MKNNNLIDLINDITNSYFVIENKFSKPNGEIQAANQYMAGINSKRSYTVLPYDRNGNECVAVKDDDYDNQFCYSWFYKNKLSLDESNFIFFNIQDPKDLILRIVKFLDKNGKNIKVDKLFYMKNSTEFYLHQDNNDIKIAEVKIDRKTLRSYEYVHFNYRNININIIPMSQKAFKSQTAKYDEWVENDLASKAELQ